MEKVLTWSGKIKNCTNSPIALLKRRRGSRWVLELIRKKSKINLNGPIGLLKVRGQLSWYGQLECPIMEGSWSDEYNEEFGGLEGSWALQEDCKARLPRLVFLVPGSWLESSITVSAMCLEGLARLCDGLLCWRLRFPLVIQVSAL